MTHYSLYLRHSIFLLLIFATTPASAFEVHPYFRLAYENGGGSMIDVHYDDGSDSTIHGGEGFNMAVGAELWLNYAGSLRGVATIGHKQGAVEEASNGDATFTRYPLDGLLTYRAGEHVLGVGATYHISPELDGDGVLSPASASFDDAIGSIFEYSYEVERTTRSTVTIGVRRTNITYTIAETDYSVDGSSWGMFMSLSF